MAPRIKNFHTEEVRQKIKASQLINRLQDHIFSEVDMTKTQVSAALGLLKKVVPDLQAMQVSGDADNPLTVISRIERVVVDPKKD